MHKLWGGSEHEQMIYKKRGNNVDRIPRPKSSLGRLLLYIVFKYHYDKS